MPSKCSIIGCGAKRDEKQESLTFHRLPKKEFMKRRWLEEIGFGNIKPHIKNIYICSMHFHQNSFNRTLDVLRLREDAVPSRVLMPLTCQGRSAILTENRADATSFVVKDETPDPLAEIPHIDPQPLPDSSEDPAQMNQSGQTVEKLKEKCDRLRTKVKRLNEQNRRKTKIIASLKNVIKELHGLYSTL